MTKDLIDRMNTNPECVLDIDWREETQWFSKKCIMDILMGIVDNDLCDIIGERIALEWYIACEREENTNDYYRLMDSEQYGESFRFCRYVTDSQEEGSIESYIERIKSLRKRRNDSSNKLKQLVPQPETISVHDKLMTVNHGHDIWKMVEEKNTEISLLRCQIEELKTLCNSLLVENKSHEIRRDEITREAAIEAQKTLVQQLIIYGEREGGTAGREIKLALLDKFMNDYILKGVLDESWKARLENLGRERLQSIVVNSQTTNIQDSTINSFYEGIQ